ncbi:MAG: eCIS core domain-containing protein, partial [Gemmatirosa sp.]
PPAAGDPALARRAALATAAPLPAHVDTQFGRTATPAVTRTTSDPVGTADDRHRATPVATARPASSLAPTSAPTPVAPSTRRLLQPLVGIDPHSVPVHRGASADATAAAHGADAIAAGGEIMMGGSHAESSPEGLALLAHELLHVARDRAPDHRPPIAQATGARATSRAASRAASPDGAVEEDLALAVEARVRDVARGREAAADAPARARALPAAPAVPTSAAQTGRTASADALLTGWESPVGRLRDAESPGITPGITPNVVPAGARAPHAPSHAAEAGPNASSQAPTHVLAQASAPAAAAAPTVHAASRTRSLDAPAPASSTSSPTGGDSAERGTPTADVDALARQVYDVLKRRLAAERRRGV